MLSFPIYHDSFMNLFVMPKALQHHPQSKGDEKIESYNLRLTGVRET
jgi:hypothetical protein